ncbi:BURP domain-containing protein 6-like [Wolffia australiana]
METHLRRYHSGDRPAILRSNLCDSMARYILVLLFLCAVIAEAAPPPPPPRFRIIPRGGTAQEVAGSSITPEAYWHQALPSTDIPIAFRSSLLTDSKLATPAWWRGIYGFIIPSPIGGVNVTLPNFNYQYAATQTQVRANANSTIFFRQTDLVAGSKMRVNFAAPASAAKFLPRSVADSVPFSSAKLPEILSLLSVKPRSAEADIVRKTLKRCEETPLAGETRFCATSLESVVDFSTVSLGSRDLAAVSTVVTSGKPSKQVYTIEPNGVKKLADGGALACHPEKYAYAVFYCHTARSTKAYTVSLAGAEGTKVEAVVACHTDTSKWNPKHIAFQMLKVKPGTVPVCHFLPPDHVVIARSH